MQNDTSYDTLVLKRILANSLSIDDLRDVKHEIEDMGNQDRNYDILSNCIDSMQNRERWQKESFESCMKKNNNIKKLLSLYLDKKSRKVTAARQELQKRFLYLSEREQISIMKAFLQGGKTDRQWCYDTLRIWWREELKQIDSGSVEQIS